MLKKMMIAAAVVAAGVAAPAQSKVQLGKIKLPPGFQISVWADGVSNVRSLAQSPGGTVFAGTWNAGNVYALRDENKDGKADRVITIISGLRNMPNGVAFRDGALYVAEINRIIRFDNIESKLENAGTPAVVTDKLPSDRHHGWKFIRFGPDGLLYVPVGAPCNMCDRGDPYATILRMKPDGSGTGSVRARRAQHRGLRLASVDARAVVHRQRAGQPRRQHARRRAEPRAESRHAFRLSALPRRHDRRSRVRREAAVQRVRAAGAASRSRTRARSACASIRARSFRSSIATRFSSPSTDRGTAARRSRSTAIASRSRTCRATRSCATSRSRTGWLEGRNRWGRPADLEVMPDGSMLVSDDTGGSDLQNHVRRKIAGSW